MSEIYGQLLIKVENQTKFDSLAQKFKKGEIFELSKEGNETDKYYVDEVEYGDILDLTISTSEYSDTDELRGYIFKNYSPKIYISTFDEDAYLNGKECKKSKAIRKLKVLNSNLEFYLCINNENYEKAHELLVSEKVSLSEDYLKVPNYERCFFGDYAPLMRYAVENGFHNAQCRHDQYFPYSEKGEHVLHRLIKTNDLGLIKKALSLGASPNGINGDSATLLHNIGWYMESDDYEVDVLSLISILRDYDADFNATDWKGNTPILSFCEAAFDCLDDKQALIKACIQKFIEFGADPNVFNHTGAGLKTFMASSEIISKYLDENFPSIKKYDAGFNLHSFILKCAHIQERTFIEEYDAYFSKAVEMGYLDFLLSDENLATIKTLSPEMKLKLLKYINTLNESVKILTTFLEYKLPVLIEDRVEEGMADYHEVKLYKMDDDSGNDLFDFHKSLSATPHFKLVIFHKRHFPLREYLEEEISI